MASCKICGSAVARIGNTNVCEVCGNKWSNENIGSNQTSENSRAWELLRNGDFEKATELFKQLVISDGVEYEAYWGKALADNGIVYVTDLDENKKVPTCNNLSEISFLENMDVLKAINKAPLEIAEEYKKQAEQIEKIRVEWMEKASKEPSYDIFISYKDSDRPNAIERTQDSIDAQDLYNALVDEGYKVFFSRISLRNKVSEQYEPYIYNAINTAKVMIVFGEKAEYFSSPWIKNEWSRYIKRIERKQKQNESLIVLYKNMNPGDLPAALANRQSINFASFGASTLLFKHIKKIIGDTAEKTAKQEQPSLLPEYLALLKELQSNKENEKLASNFDRDFNYSVDESTGQVLAVKYIGKEQKVVLPEKIDDFVISSIGEKCFENCDSIVEVILPKTIINIDKSAFCDCKNLTSVTIPYGLKKIEEWAFFGCNKLENITIPNSVDYIGKFAFGDCFNLKHIELSSSLTSITEHTFQDSGLESVIIKEGVTEIKQMAFRCCNLKELTLPQSLKRIEKEAFFSCNLTSLVIPNNVEFIGKGAFFWCELTHKVLPEGVRVEKDAFGCESDEYDTTDFFF